MRVNKEGKGGKEINRVRALAAHHRRMFYLRDLAGGKCVICGCEGTLEFHHKDPLTKEFIISARSRWSLAVILPELKKCELRCNPCHRRAHKLLSMKDQG